MSAPSLSAAKSETLLPASQGLVLLPAASCLCAFVQSCVFRQIILCVRSDPTGLEGGALGGHAPRAGAAAFGHHDREFVQRVGLQSRHHVVQAGGVGHLGTETHTHLNKISTHTRCRLIKSLVSRKSSELQWE